MSARAADARDDLSGLPARALAPAPTAGDAPLFSVCSLVTDAGQHRRMVEGFVSHGFGADRTEYLYADNRSGNAADGYGGLGRLIAAARGTLVICRHQDVEAVDEGADPLAALLAELDRHDPAWAVAANAGAARGGAPRRVSDNIGGPDQRAGPFPAAVEAVDENFIVLRRAALMAPSRDLPGFHLYGFDLWLQAWLPGWSAYVIDFPLRHQGRGAGGCVLFRQRRGAGGQVFPRARATPDLHTVPAGLPDFRPRRGSSVALSPLGPSLALEAPERGGPRRSPRPAAAHMTCRMARPSGATSEGARSC